MKWLELKIPPVAVFAIFAGVLWWAATQSPGADFTIPFRKLLAILLGVLGGALGAFGVWSFFKARTTIHPHRPEHSAALVTAGLYRITRNPMYLGLLLILTGWAVALSNVLTFLLLPGFVAYMNRFQIVPEERILRDKFGEKFDAYARSVRRWL